MSNRKKELIDIFQDTLEKSKKYDLNKSLEESYVNKTRGIEIEIHKFKDSEVLFWPMKTTVAAREAKKKFPESAVCMLNFASQRNPGGGVTWGCSAQEESMCRSTTLYPIISNPRFKPVFYEVKPLLSESILIYTPDIKIIKDESSADYNPLRVAVPVNVITCAAPNLKYIKISNEDLYKSHKIRAQNIINEAARQNDILITGAFGCGAYRNNPEIVAEVWHDLLMGQYKGAFQKVIFAIPYDKNWSEWDRRNMEVFKKIFEN